MGDSLADYPHVALAIQYARDVQAGRIVTCHWVKRATLRQLDDLKAWQAGNRKDWKFDYAAADYVCAFLELLPHIKGRWARKGQTLKLEPWQCFVVSTVFGWYKRDEFSGGGWARRFRTVYEEVGRKNAKTTKVAGVGLYMGFSDDEPGAEVYSAATSRPQARICFDIARLMASSKHAVGLREELGVEVMAHNISSLDQASKFEPVSSEARGLDGFSPHLAIIDEFHAHRTPEVRDAMRLGMGARESPLEWIVTTAGTNLASPCFQEQAYAKKVLDGVVEDDSYFAIIYTIDQGEGVDGAGGDDWTDPACWIKANPNLGVSVFADDIKRDCMQAQEDPIKQVGFLTKRLNIWVSADVRAINMQRWAECGEPFDINDLMGEPVVTAIDLATKQDIAALMMVWDIDDHVYVKGRYFLPREVVRERAHSTHAHYAGWAAAGLFDLTEGDIIDLKYIENECLEMPTLGFDVEGYAVDPWQAGRFMIAMQEAGATVVEIRPTVQNFSDPFKELIAKINTKRFHHGNDPILTWMAANVVAHSDKKDNIYPNKARAEDKIDGIVAILMAMQLISRRAKPLAPAYSNREVLVI